MVAVTAAVVVAVVLAVVLTRPGGAPSAKGGEVFLQSANSAGPNPYTKSTARQSSALPPPSGSAAPSTGTVNAVRGVSGGAPGLYGGTQKVAACDVEQQIRFLRADPARNRSFASVAGVEPAGVPGYLRSLTPVQLRVDTRVTNHGYRDGRATAYQAVLQAGTAVLVDGHGVPRVRCACGNPLTPPVAQRAAPEPVGARWPSYRPSGVVVVMPARKPLDVFVIYDSRHDDWIHRQRADRDCRHDRRAKPPAEPHPWATPGGPSWSQSSSPGSPSSPPGSSPSPPSSASSSSPQSKPPESRTPETKPPGSGTPESRSPQSSTPKPSSPESKGSEPSSESSPESPSKPSSEPPASTPAQPSSGPRSAGTTPTGEATGGKTDRSAGTSAPSRPPDSGLPRT
nr:DUF6777 domain-containing protein [Streptomyces lucensis]